MTLDTLIHDVNSKCASLKDAAALLRGMPTAEAKELLALMTRQALSLADSIEEYAEELTAP
ncbi:MAG: hypothetical protein A2V88_01420 [Elusimicrobia bacterium RBG_16_66_12]|nr:MAG: hypothetical protein A2V88_01420 [Elusimicrobia bacterium RBG_16_66_12]